MFPIMRRDHPFANIHILNETIDSLIFHRIPLTFFFFKLLLFFVTQNYFQIIKFNLHKYYII